MSINGNFSTRKRGAMNSFIDAPGGPSSAVPQYRDELPAFGLGALKANLDALSEIQIRELVVALTEKEPALVFSTFSNCQVRLMHAQKENLVSKPVIDTEYIEAELNRAMAFDTAEATAAAAAAEGYGIFMTAAVHKYIRMFHCLMDAELDFENGANILRAMTDVLADHWHRVQHWMKDGGVDLIHRISGAWQKYAERLSSEQPDGFEEQLVLELGPMMAQWQQAFSSTLSP